MSKTLHLDDKTARGLYPGASPEFKTLLEKNWGKDFFSQSLKDRIKSWADVVAELGEEACVLPFQNPKNSDQRATNAFHKLTIIIRLFKHGVKLDYNNSSQWKYWPWFKKSGSGFAFTVASTAYGRTDSHVGPRLSSKSESDAEYIAKTFPDLYNDLFNESDI